LVDLFLIRKIANLPVQIKYLFYALSRFFIDIIDSTTFFYKILFKKINMRNIFLDQIFLKRDYFYAIIH